MFSLRKKFKDGVLFFFYIITYSVSQIVVFFWRANDVIFWGLKQAQLTAIGVLIVALIGLYWYIKKVYSPAIEANNKS